MPPGGHAIPDSLEQRQADGWSFPGAVVHPGMPAGAGMPVGAMAQGGPAQERGFVPVPAPSPLPPSALAFAPATPALDGTYRSTVDIPPPPLLDAQLPPPLTAGWSTHDVARAAAPAPPAAPVTQVAPPPAFVAAVAVPATTYVVRDGDDLTSIALAVYGHAGAAAAIWAANADRLSDPGLLPIGLALTLPPSWTLPASAATAGGGQPAIEPATAGAAVAGSRGSTVASPQTPPAVTASHGDEAAASGGSPHWLAPARGLVATPAAMPQRSAPTAVPVARRPGSVRVAAGETLETLAARFYGDRGMAQRIWLANRDRLRSPDLLVPGMELTLP
jgi:nucleoid-associated protein YgaU